ncbi:unnamed protein product [Owenia fusiformis]|uniref:Importin-13 n=1 Tax=Owenia fusiformis TaxID=6347 RepID=A0A8J1XQT7_OWEFU|nr:unnamed protein product [Owenia fusiformis]
MDFTVDNIEHALQSFYSEATVQKEANRWLTEAQVSSQAWTFSWQLLSPEKPAEVQFFGASSLHIKVSKFWHELPTGEVAPLRNQLFERIVQFAKGPRMVLTRLCVTLSAFAMNTIPEVWPEAIHGMITTFQQAQLPGLQSEDLCRVLLELLTVLPEEFSVAHIPHDRKPLVRHELQKGLSQVLQLLQSLLSPNSPPQIHTQALKCFGSWVEFGVPLVDSQVLIQQVFLAAQHEPLFETAIDTLCTIFSHHSAYKYPSCIKSMLTNVVQLKPLLDKSIQESDLGNTQMLCRLVSTVGENHPKVLISDQTDPQHCNNVRLLISMILQCTGLPGHFPVDESCSDITFTFWYILQDDILSCESANRVQLVRTFQLVYISLVEVLLRKVQYPDDKEYTSWNKEEKEQLRCYRQDIADTLMYTYALLQPPNSLLGFLKDHIVNLVNRSKAEQVRWQDLEAVLFMISSCSDSAEMTEAIYLPTIFSQLVSIPFTHISLISTALNLIGSYAEWINFNPEVLSSAIPLVLQGIGNQESSSCATMALKDLTRENQSHLLPFAKDILHTCETVLASNTLKPRDAVRLMVSVGYTVSILPVSDMMSYLNTLLAPHIQSLKLLIEQQPSVAGKNAILMKLGLLSWLFTSLNTDRETDGSPPPEWSNQQQQPILVILQDLFPVLQSLMVKWSLDVGVVECVCEILKRAIRTLMDAFAPLSLQTCQLIAHIYQSTPHIALLDLAKQLIILFGSSEFFRMTGVSLFNSLCTKTLATLQLGLHDRTDLVEGFMNMLHQMIKKCSYLFLNTECNLDSLLQAGIAGMALAEGPTVKSSCLFLSEFLGAESKIPNSPKIVQSHCGTLVETILKCVSGESPRSNMGPISDVLLALNKFHFQLLSQCMTTLIQQDSINIGQASTENKQTFARMVLKERVNKRKLREIVNEFTLACRGLLGTDYAAQTALTI